MEIGNPFISVMVKNEQMFVLLNFQLGLVDRKNSEYDQEIPQSQTADNPVAPLGRDSQPSRDTRKTN